MNYVSIGLGTPPWYQCYADAGGDRWRRAFSSLSVEAKGVPAVSLGNNRNLSRCVSLVCFPTHELACNMTSFRNRFTQTARHTIPTRDQSWTNHSRPTTRGWPQHKCHGLSSCDSRVSRLTTLSTSYLLIVLQSAKSRETGQYPGPRSNASIVRNPALGLGTNPRLSLLQTKPKGIISVLKATNQR